MTSNLSSVPAGRRHTQRKLVPSVPDARIVIISNRGPRDFVWKGGHWTTQTASGGLVSMLTSLARRSDVAWFCCVSEPPDARQAEQALFTTAADQLNGPLHVVPVPLPAEVYNAYYGQISNEVLWMLQHHVIGPRGYHGVDAGRHRAWADGYVEATQRIAEAVAATCPSAEAFLIQDYHLYLLPRALRAAFPDTPMLHFTHIPFPGPSLFKLLPRSWREAILEGLLAADIVGFQTASDVRAFLGCCSENLGSVDVDLSSDTVRMADGRRVRVRPYPASVDPVALRRLMRTAGVGAALERLTPTSGERYVIRVDRLDPSKNQAVGFLAFGRLLELRPDLCGRLRFLAFLVPSRTDLRVYRAYRDEIYQTIETINIRFASACGGPPIEVFYTNDRDQALAAMALGDVLLVNSLQDGMNLVAKEWAVVSQRPGALVLSETTGVVDEAIDSALLVSPLDVEGTAIAMAAALDMPASERRARVLRFQERIKGWTARHWLSTQLADLGLPSRVPVTKNRTP